MASQSAPAPATFDHLREQSFGLPQVLFQSITLAFLPPLYYQYRPLAPEPLRYGNWAAIGLFILCVLLTIFMATRRRDVLENPHRIFTSTEVDDIDEYPAPATTPATP